MVALSKIYQTHMSIQQKLSSLSSRAKEQSSLITSEEATKTSLIMPFLSILGYDPFNPAEIVPEFTADVGTKKKEKVDYAIRHNEVISILIECKPLDSDLSDADYSQLYRYFGCTDTRFAILTNGIEYRFYTDLEESNKMDSKPFFTFFLYDYTERDIEELKKFSRDSFDVNSILSTANRLKYTNLAKKAIEESFKDTPEDFVKHLIGKVYEGRQTRQVIDEFTPIIRAASKAFIQDQVAYRLKDALNFNGGSQSEDMIDTDSESQDEKGIITTQSEIDGYNIVRSILSESVDISRVHMRDSKSYCAILLDDNNRKPICRLHFNNEKSKKVCLFEGKDKLMMDIENLSEIFGFREQLIKQVEHFNADSRSE